MIARVQTTSLAASSNSASAVTISFPANVAAGSLIVVFVGTYNNVTVTVTDNLGNTYSQAGAYATNAPPKGSLWYAANVTGGACTITVTPSAAAYVSTVAAEYSGAQSTPLDSTATATGTSSTPSTGTVTVSGTAGLVCGLLSFNATGAFAAVIDKGMGALVAQLSGSNNEQIIAVDNVNTASVAVSARLYTPAGVASSGTWTAVGASFKPVSAGGGGSTFFSRGILTGGRL